jgi:hypothetical protein
MLALNSQYENANRITPPPSLTAGNRLGSVLVAVSRISMLQQLEWGGSRDRPEWENILETRKTGGRLEREGGK